MSETAALLDQVLSLPEQKRAEIAVRLLESLEPETLADVEVAWAEEIESRCAAVGMLGLFRHPIGTMCALALSETSFTGDETRSTQCRCRR